MIDVSVLAVRASRHERANDRVFAAADGTLLPVATRNPAQYLDWPAELERARARLSCSRITAAKLVLA